MLWVRAMKKWKKWLNKISTTIGMAIMISATTLTTAATNNVSINISPQAPPGISNGILTLLSYIDWAVLVGAIGAILVGILHLTGIMGDSSNAKKYLGGGILAIIIWAGLFAFIKGFI